MLIKISLDESILLTCESAFSLAQQAQLSCLMEEHVVWVFGLCFLLNLDRLKLCTGRFVHFQEATDSIYSCQKMYIKLLVSCPTQVFKLILYHFNTC